MPGGGGAWAVSEITRTSPRTRVVVLSAYDDVSTVVRMLRSGAVAYLVKGGGVDEVIATIERVGQGEGTLSSQITVQVIHELVQAVNRSEQLAEEFKELDSMKRGIVQILSHELLTPVTLIQGAARLLASAEGRLSGEDLECIYEGVARAGLRLRRLVRDIGAAARLDRPGVEVAVRPVVVGELIAAALGEFSGEAIRLRVADSAAAVGTKVWADPDLARRALVAVMENAFAFSGEETVELDVVTNSLEVQFAISDRGGAQGVGTDPGHRGTVGDLRLGEGVGVPAGAPPAEPAGGEHDHLTGSGEGEPGPLGLGDGPDDEELDLRARVAAPDGPGQAPFVFPRSKVFSMVSSLRARSVRASSCLSSLTRASSAGRPGPCVARPGLPAGPAPGTGAGPTARCPTAGIPRRRRPPWRPPPPRSAASPRR
jgi:CheY-like chemotaxis protein